MKIRFETVLKFTSEYDTETGKTEIISVVPINKNDDDGNAAKEIHNMSETEHKYKILTLGAKFAKNYAMAVAEEISIRLNGEMYPQKVTTHASVAGRIDGLTDFSRWSGLFLEEYERLNNTYSIEISFDAINKVLDINADYKSKYSPRDAAKRALEEYKPGKQFSLPDLYTKEEWIEQLPVGVQGVLGKNFFSYISTYEKDIVMVKNDNPAVYQIKKTLQ